MTLDTAMVLAAGYGTRLGELTRELPKPMLDICGRPLLAYTLSLLARSGISRVLVNLHFMPEIITDTFGDGSAFGLHLEYSHETTLLGTAGGVAKIRNRLESGKPLLVLYGDILTDLDLRAMADFHARRQADGTLILHQRAKSNSLVALEDDGRISDFIERPDHATRARYPYPWVNSGIQILGPAVLDALPETAPCDLPRDVYAPNIRQLRLYGKPLDAYRCAIDSPDRYRQAVQAVRQGQCNQSLVNIE